MKVAGGDHGGSWAARIKGEPIDQGISFLGEILILVDKSNLNFPEKPSRISTIFYFGLEGLGGLDMETNENDDVSFNLSTANSPH